MWRTHNINFNENVTRQWNVSHSLFHFYFHSSLRVLSYELHNQIITFSPPPLLSTHHLFILACTNVEKHKCVIMWCWKRVKEERARVSTKIYRWQMPSEQWMMFECNKFQRKMIECVSGERELDSNQFMPLCARSFALNITISLSLWTRNEIKNDTKVHDRRTFSSICFNSTWYTHRRLSIMI